MHQFQTPEMKQYRTQKGLVSCPTHKYWKRPGNKSLNPCSICSDLYLAKLNKQNSRLSIEQCVPISCKELCPWKDPNSRWGNTKGLLHTVPLSRPFGVSVQADGWAAGMFCVSIHSASQNIWKGSNVWNIHEPSFKRRERVTREQAAGIWTEKALSAIHSVRFILTFQMC